MIGREGWLVPDFWKKVSVVNVRRYLAKGAKINARDESGKTPLHLAAAWSNASVVLVLIDAGAEIEACDEGGATALHMAVKARNFEILNTLLEVGANANARTDVEQSVMLDTGSWTGYDKTTALHMAAIEGNVEILRALLEAGADVNASTSRGLTPLHYAAIWGTSDATRLLIDAGSDANARDVYGLTPQAYASKAVRGILEAEVGEGVIDPSCLVKENKNIMLYWDDAPPPPDVSKVVETWQKFCPTWKVKLFNQESACRFIHNEFGEDIAKLFLACALPAMRSDFFRVLWGVSEGGIYSDVTFVPTCEPFFFDLGKNLTVTRRPNGLIRNGIFFSKKGCRELKLVAYEIIRSVSQKKLGSIIEITGPIVWRKTLWQRETSTMAIVDWKHIFGKFLSNSDYKSTSRDKNTHWSRMQKRIEIYREPPENY